MRGILNSGGKVKDQENPLVHLLGSDIESVLLSLESVIAEATGSCFFLANPNQTNTDCLKNIIVVEFVKMLLKYFFH